MSTGKDANKGKVYGANKPQNLNQYWDFIKYAQKVPRSQRQFEPIIKAYVRENGATAPAKSTLERWVYQGAKLAGLGSIKAADLCKKVDDGDFDLETRMAALDLTAKYSGRALQKLAMLIDKAMDTKAFKDKLMAEPKSMIPLAKQLQDIHRNATRPAADTDITKLDKDESMQVMVELLERHPGLKQPLYDVLGAELNGE